MIHQTWLIAVLTSVISAAALTHSQDDHLEQGFQKIFDGKSLDGWRVTPAKYSKAWSVKQGCIVGDGDQGQCYLEFQKTDLADFDLRFSYLFPAKGNSGVSIRAVQDPTGKRKFQSYHADLGHVGIGKHILGAWDFHTPGRKEHGCPRGYHLLIDPQDHATYSELKDPITVEEIRHGDWNEARIVARGNNFKFYLNGKLSAEFSEQLPLEKRLQKGAVQLQLHDPQMIVKFKKIRLKILK